MSDNKLENERTGDSENLESIENKRKWISKGSEAARGKRYPSDSTNNNNSGITGS